jgi:hypothetical protein
MSQVRTIIRDKRKNTDLPTSPSKHSSHGTSLHTTIYHIICSVHSAAKPEFMTQGSLHIQSASFMASIYFNASHMNAITVQMIPEQEHTQNSLTMSFLYMIYEEK